MQNNNARWAASIFGGACFGIGIFFATFAALIPFVFAGGCTLLVMYAIYDIWGWVALAVVSGVITVGILA
jgi:hypothetical protein